MLAQVVARYLRIESVPSVLIHQYKSPNCLLWTMYIAGVQPHAVAFPILTNWFTFDNNTLRGVLLFHFHVLMSPQTEES